MANGRVLDGKEAIITGGNGGLGSVVARAFEEAGARVARADPADSDSKVEAFAVTKSDDMAGGVAHTIEHYSRIDILLNLVGTWRRQPPVTELGEDLVDLLFTLNFKSVFLVSRAVASHMIENGWGRIVNVGAMGALRGMARNAAYATSKAAVLAFTEALAAELDGTGVTANAVIPSTIDTPPNRASMPDADHSAWVSPLAIARTMRFLCSDNASEINGARIPVWNRA